MSKDLQNRLNNIIKSLPQKTISINELRSLLATNKRFSTERAINESIAYLKKKKIKVVEDKKEELQVILTPKKKTEEFDEELEIEDPVFDEDINDEEEKNIEKVSLDSIPNALVQYYNDLSAIDTEPLDKETEYELIKRAQADDIEARDEFINHNLCLALKMAKYYYDQIYTTLALDDLIQEANIGLLEALKRFDVSMNYRFSTYAMRWIKAKIIRILAAEGRTIKLPVYLIELTRNVKSAINALEQETAGTPTDEQILNYLVEKGYKINHGITLNIDYIRKAKKVLEGRMVSLHSPVGEEQDSELGDFIPSFDFSPIEDLERLDLIKKINEALPMLLNNKECDIIRKRYGLYPDQKYYTLPEIAKEYGVSHQAIQQLEHRACMKLKRGSVGTMLRNYFEYRNFNDFDLTPGKKDTLF